MKPRLYIDITNLMQVTFLSGIQRAVREIILEFIKKDEFQLQLLVSCGVHRFKILTAEQFVQKFGITRPEENIDSSQNATAGHDLSQKSTSLDSFQNSQTTINTAQNTGIIGFHDFVNGSAYLELDSAWHNQEPRTELLSALRTRGVRIILSLYDLIPVMYPQYVHERTRLLFMKFLAAYLQYADLILTSTETAVGYVENLCHSLQIPVIPAKAAPLGSSNQPPSSGSDQQTAPLGSSNQPPSSDSGTKTILMVGTIEPRKNHQLVLDAFDHCLFEKGYHLVLVGNSGWKMEAFEQRIKKHPLLGKQLFLKRGIEDEELRELYRTSYFLAFPSFAEGFGLPVIEAIRRGLPVLASDYGVIKEVGQDYCRYFSPNDEQAFIELIEYYSKHTEEYFAWKKHLKEYVPFTWSESAAVFANYIHEELESRRGNVVCENVCSTNQQCTATQLVVLSARIEDLSRTVPFWELYFTGIEELVVCCPPKMADEMKSIKTGRFRVTVITDTEILQGEKLPEDHQLRNFYLRARLIADERIQPVFIMTDDDYRPLCEIMPEVYHKNGCYQAYYCYMAGEWRGVEGNLTSFDEGVERTDYFLKQNHYSEYLFSSHMPQMIDKKMFLEMLSIHPELLQLGPCEWTSYFNYVASRYPERIQIQPYVTMNWPGNTVDWDLYCEPTAFLFENYYRYLYEDGRIFEGIDADFPETLSDVEARVLLTERNNEKISRVKKAILIQENGRKQYALYCKEYVNEYGEQPDYSVCLDADKLTLFTPVKAEFSAGSCIRIPVELYGTKDKCRIQTCFISEKGGVGVVRASENRTAGKKITVPLIIPTKTGAYTLQIEAQCADKKAAVEVKCVVG